MQITLFQAFGQHLGFFQALQFIFYFIASKESSLRVALFARITTPTTPTRIRTPISPTTPKVENCRFLIASLFSFTPVATLLFPPSSDDDFFSLEACIFLKAASNESKV